MDAIVAHVAEDADHFAPQPFRVRADPFADRRRRRTPQLARHVLGHDGDGAAVVLIFPGEIPARDERSPHRPHEAGNDEFEHSQRRNLRLGVGTIRGVDRIVPGTSRHRNERRERHRGHARDGCDPVHHGPVHPHHRRVFLHLSLRDEHAEGLQLLRLGESGRYVAQRRERADHQARADQQHQRERHLGDDERVARAMTLPAGAGGASAAAKRRFDPWTRIFEHRNRAKQQARCQRQRQREQQHRAVDGDLVDPRDVAGRERHQHSQRADGHAEPGGAAKQTEHEALDQQLARDLRASGAQRRPDGQLLLARLGPNQQQVGDVGAGDQHHDADHSHQHPQHGLHVADDIGLERVNARHDPCLLEGLDAQAGEWRKARERDRNHPRHVGVRGWNRHARLQAGDCVVAEVSEKHLAAIETLRQDERGSPVEEVERVGQYADDFARRSVERHRSAHSRGIAAEFRAPVPGHENDRLGAGRRIVGLREQPAEHRPHAQNRQHAVGDEQRRHFLGFGETGDAHGAARPETDVLKRASIFAIREVLERGGAGVGQIERLGGVIEDHQLLGPRIRQGLEQHAFDDAEDRGVCPDANGQRQRGSGGKQRHFRKPPRDLVEAHRC